MAHLNQQAPKKKTSKNKKINTHKRKTKNKRLTKPQRAFNSFRYNSTENNFVTRFKAVWSKFRHWWTNKPIFMQLMILVTSLFIFFSIIFGYTNARMNAINEKTEAKANRYEPDNNYLVKKGAVSYLKDQLDIKSTKELKKKINETAKYHGQYDSIIQQAKQCTDNASLWKILNPVVDAVQSGQRYRANQTVKPEFKIYDTASIPNYEYDNLIVISYNSKDDNQTKIINQFVKNNPTVRTIVFDTSTKGGKQAFQVPMYNFLNNGGEMINGYDSSNSWTGIAYAFMDDELTYHTKNINDLSNMKGLPKKSLANDNINNTNEQPNQQDYR